MINLLVFSIIVGIVSSLIIVPFTTTVKTNKNNEEQELVFNRWAALASTAALIAAIVFGFYYVSNIDRNWTSLWVMLLIVTIMGVVFAGSKDRKSKIVLFIGAAVFGVYLLSAPLFNADKKYKAVEMDQKVEITAFDETKTPASVPPKFARNKMKKAFGQVPNTSYYELGNLQIQKVGDEFRLYCPC